MRTCRLTNEELDRIGRNVLKAVRASDEEVDQIVNAESLFDPVRDAIRAGRSQRPTLPLHGWTRRHAWRWQVSVALSSVLIVATFGLTSFVRQNALSPEMVRELREQMSPIDLPQAFPPLIDQFESSTPPDQAGVPQAAAHSGRRVVKPHITKRVVRSETPDVGEFQALTYTGDSVDIDDGGQIVRVELPRSSLFALGVDLPVENRSTGKVKADLLIGEDGVMKAVRIVN